MVLYRRTSTSLAARLLLVVLAVLATMSWAFVPTSSLPKAMSAPPVPTHATHSTSLAERQWNFNEGQSPWGLKKNAEIWNGRVAQMAFVWIFLQELITGKGVFKGLEEGDAFFIANIVLFGVSVVALTAWLAIQGDNDYTKD